MGDLMKRNLLLVASLFAAAACGGKAKPAPPTPPPAPPPAAAEPEAKPEPEPPKPEPPKEWHAKAELTPVKGNKMKVASVSFAQTEGDAVHLTTEGPLEGLKVGKFHLVVHEAAECGPNATKVGAAWPTVLDLEVPKGRALALDQSSTELTLDGEKSVVGHTLVLHEDKKGKPGKAIACGPITASDAPAAAE